AKGIAESLQAKLTGHEEQALAVKPTNNPEAYDAYLRGLSFDARFHFSIGDADPGLKAVGFNERAVQLDPKFALASALLSRAHSVRLVRVFDHPPRRGDGTNKCLEHAENIQPDSAETQAALGY